MTGPSAWLRWMAAAIWIEKYGIWLDGSMVPRRPGRCSCGKVERWNASFMSMFWDIDDEAVAVALDGATVVTVDRYRGFARRCGTTSIAGGPDVLLRLRERVAETM